MSFIQNFFTSRDNQLVEVDDQTGNIGNTFVGQISRLWYNPDDNSIYVSDGSTPGGILVAGPGGGNPFDQNLNTYNDVTFANLTVTGNVNFSNTATVDLGNLQIYDQTITGTISNRDVNIAVVGANAHINIDGPFNVHGTGNLELEPQFQVASDGQATFRVPALDTNSGAVEIVGSTSGAIVPLGNPGGMLHITGQNNQVSRLYNDSISNYPLYVGRRFNGTAAAPTGVLAGQVVSRLGANPYLTDAAEFTPLGFAKIDFVATEDQTTTAQGSKVQIYTTPDGSNTQVITATFQPEGIDLGGNLIPTVNNTYQLGNNTNKWDSLYIGPSSLYIEDSVLGTDAEITVSNGALLINGTQKIQIGNMQMTTTGISLVNPASAANLLVGADTNTGYMEVNMVGIKFKDDSLQTTAAIPLSYLAAANGVATLGSDSKVLPSQLPAGAVFFKGTWLASNNTPTLADGSGTAGWEYQAVDSGTVNFGSGPIAFLTGDFVIYNGTVWQRIPGSGAGVTSFNTRTGVVTLNSGDVTNALSNGSITNNYLSSPNISITTGQGIGSNKATVELGTSVTLTNTGVTAAIGGTGVGVSAATGNVTFSIGQAVGTANSVQFAGITSSTTVQATGNITGGNIATGGRVVATGNIVTSGYLITPTTSINNGIVTTGNITGGNLSIGNAGTFGTTVSAVGNITGGNLITVGNTTTANLTVTGISNLNSNANVKITGGTDTYLLATDGTGNLRWVPPNPTANTYVAANANSYTVDFSSNSLTLLYQPTGTVNLTLTNYTAGHQARVMIRFGATNYPINLGILNAAQSTEGLLTIPISGGGGHNTKANSTVQLLYTCFDNSAGNCYVAATFF